MGLTGNIKRAFSIWKYQKEFGLKLRKKTSDRTVFYNVIVKEQYKDLLVDNPVNIIDAKSAIAAAVVSNLIFFIFWLLSIHG